MTFSEWKGATYCPSIRWTFRAMRERERERERARERERVARLREMVLVGVFYEDVTNVQQWLLGVLTESVARTLLLLLK